MPVEYPGVPASDCRSTESDDYSLWGVDGSDGKPLLHRVSGATLDRKHQPIPIGNWSGDRSRARAKNPNYIATSSIETE